MANIRECHDDLIHEFVDSVLEVAVPRWTHINGEREQVLPRRRFYPTEALRRIFTITNVRRILAHECDNCSMHLANIQTAHPSQYAAERILRTDATLNVFALLVILRHPLLVGIFLTTYDLTSLPLPRYFSPYDLNDRQFRHLPYRAREQLASNFEEQKWQFSVPKFTDGTFESYQEGTILPYVDEEPIGRGGFGSVFKVWVHPNYCTLSPVQVADSSSRNPGSKIFARKEIMGGDDIEFLKEKNNLERIATLKDPHLVQIQKTYQLGDKFNILFPFAKTNLYDYLRNRRWYAPQHARINKNPLWEQVLGITVALNKIINFTDPDDPDHVFFGYHLDLKPQNILIDNSATGSRDTFKITDFGQATFLDPAFATTTRIHGSGGTDAYAPPEYLQAHQDRVYDVWSLGIIVLEILAFAIRGVDGLLHQDTGLDNVRHTKEGGHSNSRFYTFVDSQPVVKRKILDWVESLVNDESIKKESREFVRNLQMLIMDMLEPQMKDRITIDKVAVKMRKIFQMKATEAIEVTAESLKEKDEIILVDLRKVDYYPRGVHGNQSMRVPLLIVENNSHRLRTWVDTPVVPACDQRQEMKLILAFQHTKDVDNNFFEILFAATRDDYAVSLQGQSIVLDDKAVARRVQTAMIGHEVSERYRLTHMTLKTYQPPLKEAASKLKSFASGSFLNSKKTEGEGSGEAIIPLWVELWIEKPQIPSEVPSSPPATGKSAQRRANRRVNPGNHIPLGRVVIYCKDRIIILPFAKECRLVNQKEMKHLKEQEITFEPMDKKQCEFFYVSYILPSRDQLPGIPMHHAALKNAEAKSKFRCESLVLKFENSDNAYTFYKLYKTEKVRWLEGIKGNIVPNTSRMPQN